MIYPLLFSALTFLTATASSSTSDGPSVITPEGTILGSSLENVDYFRGIPYAEPPVGPLRLRPPVRATSVGIVNATGVGPACPQFTNVHTSPLWDHVVSFPGVKETSFLGVATDTGVEDCLTISVMRPADPPPTARLPVLFWIHGGGFEIGSAQPYNGSVLIPRSVQLGKPIIIVTVNYRLSGFGFLGGQEILKDGAANLGLLDQRMALEWVADNIHRFGGDPGKVTIVGESAGAMSVFDQLALYDGKNTYKGRPLFRAAVMHSGGMLPAEPVDGKRAQHVFDTVVEDGGCVSAADKLECLRGLDFAAFNKAVNSVDAFLSYSSVALSYVPRPDGKILTASGEVLAREKRLAEVPIIVGVMADEGTIFALYHDDITDKAGLVSYLKEVLYPDAPKQDLASLVDTYYSCPYVPPCRQENPYPEYQRLSAIMGDTVFTAQRRHLLSHYAEETPVWSFLGTWTSETPILGCYHTSDMIQLFYGRGKSARTMQDRYIAFVNGLDPNEGLERSDMRWPRWREGRKVLEFGKEGTRVVDDDVREESFRFIEKRWHIFRQ